MDKIDLTDEEKRFLTFMFKISADILNELNSTPYGYTEFSSNDLFYLSQKLGIEDY